MVQTPSPCFFAMSCAPRPSSWYHRGSPTLTSSWVQQTGSRGRAGGSSAGRRGSWGWFRTASPPSLAELPPFLTTASTG